MLAEERFAQILALMAEKRTATVQELCEALNASESTIRRDLNELDRLGKVNKVHGGATLPDSQFRADEPTMAATVWRWTQASPRRTPRKRLSRLRPSGGRGKPGSSWMTPSSPASTRRSSPSCTAGRS